MASKSEQYLALLAESTFLKPWAIANPFHRPGKEITDLLVPFARDLILFSDKACNFNSSQQADLAWTRWERAAIDESIKQLDGAVRALEREDCTVFTDNTAQDPLSFPIPSPADRRYHLVAVARPSQDPTTTPEGWATLTYNDRSELKPFQIGPQFAGGRFVHVFEGSELDLILKELDTAPDLITYLTRREELLRIGPQIEFVERDFLATAISNWANGRDFAVTLDDVRRGKLAAGNWERYKSSRRVEETRAASKDSYIIDQLISEFHREHLEYRASGRDTPYMARHEEAMRLLAMEGRFARRIITDPLLTILDEDEQHIFWAMTVPSPTSPGVRYVWLTYPKKPKDWSDDQCAYYISEHLQQYIIVAADTFPEETVIIGLAVPNRLAEDNLLAMRVFDAANPSEHLKAEAEHWRRQGVFDNLEAQQFMHLR